VFLQKNETKCFEGAICSLRRNITTNVTKYFPRPRPLFFRQKSSFYMALMHHSRRNCVTIVSKQTLRYLLRRIQSIAMKSKITWLFVPLLVFFCAGLYVSGNSFFSRQASTPLHSLQQAIVCPIICSDSITTGQLYLQESEKGISQCIEEVFPPASYARSSRSTGLRFAGLLFKKILSLYL
jgi:hypothetical protein